MSRIIVESMTQVDVNELNRLGAFEGSSGGWIREFPFLGLRTSRHLIEYRGTDWPADRPPQRVLIQWTPCTYGGARPWLTCPCGRRCGKLYYGNGFLGCRPCGDMIYESQRKGAKGRLYLRATRIRARLGNYGRPGIDGIPERPWRMRQRTYNNLKAELAIIEGKFISGRIYRPRSRRERSKYARMA